MQKRPRNFVLNGSYLFKRYVDTNRPGAFGKIGGTEGKALELFGHTFRKIIHTNRHLRNRRRLFEKSGVFPDTEETFNDFCRAYACNALPEMDALVFWRGKDDITLRDRLAPGTIWIDWDCLAIRGMLDPLSWYGSLKNKKILVITSFAHTVRHQCSRLNEVWKDKPWMHHLAKTEVLACPSYSHLIKPVDQSWKSGLERLRREMERIDFDICLIGAGAWSLPLTVHAKKLGKIGIHMGGTVQLMFGIKGNRWIKTGELDNVANEHWTFPLKEDTPTVENKVEDNAYWERAKSSET